MADTLEEVKAGQLRERRAEYQLDDRIRPARPGIAELLRRDWHHLGVIGRHLSTIAAHIMGELLKFMGEDRIVFGTDSVW